MSLLAVLALTFSEHGDLLCRVGFGTCSQSVKFSDRQSACPTNCADDARSAVVLLGRVVDVQACMPFHLGAVVEMVQSVTHFEVCILLVLSIVVKVVLLKEDGNESPVAKLRVIYSV